MNKEHQCPNCLVYHTGRYALCDYCQELDLDEYDYETDDINYDSWREDN